MSVRFQELNYLFPSFRLCLSTRTISAVISLNNGTKFNAGGDIAFDLGPRGYVPNSLGIRWASVYLWCGWNTGWVSLIPPLFKAGVIIGNLAVETIQGL
jgi:hypothetical protein